MDGVDITGPRHERYDEILTPQALGLVAALQRELGARREALLAARHARQAEIAAGGTLDFLTATRSVREDPAWRVADAAPGLVDRRVEITGPTDRKMTINALNSGAKVWLADFEDANTPLWENMVGGQLNLRDALDRRIDFTSPEGKEYRLRPDDELATIVVRPRGWHLPEKHVLVDGQPVSGSLFDFALYLVHCGQRQLDRGLGPYFYLPKMESHLEARLWNDAFNLAQDTLGLPRGTIRATVLIETIPAAFEMEEILYELRDHSAGLNAGRWDYLFSIIKTFRLGGAGKPSKDFLLPDRNAVTMTAPFMRAYTELLVSTCHRRGAHAIGGMAAFIPSRRDPDVNAKALAKVREDKEREAGDGFDGSWVAHPDLVPLCREVFDGVLGDRPHQRDRLRDDVRVTAADLLNIAATPGEATEAGVRSNINVALRYLASWLGGQGAVAISNLMEDAATAEISRSQLWQWIHNGVFDRGTVERLLAQEYEQLDTAADPQRYAAARALFEEVAIGNGAGPDRSHDDHPHDPDHYVDFLTLPAYERMP